MTLKQPLTKFGMLVYYINFVLLAFLEVSWTGSKIISPKEDRGLFSLVQTMIGVILEPGSSRLGLGSPSLSNIH